MNGAVGPLPEGVWARRRGPREQGTALWHFIEPAWHTGVAPPDGEAVCVRTVGDRPPWGPDEALERLAGDKAPGKRWAISARGFCPYCRGYADGRRWEHERLWAAARAPRYPPRTSTV